jgi:putative DNA primase/helicase
MSDIDQLKASVSIAAVINETLPLKRKGRLLVSRCPFHGEKTPSFMVYHDHFHCFGCGERGDVVDWLMATRRMTFKEAVRHLSGPVQTRATPIAPLPPTGPDTTVCALRIWAEATDPRGTPVERYLKSRLVSLPEAPVIRFHPRCPRTGGPLPAMVALMANPETGQPCGIHRTFLAPDGAGKAQVESPKMMLGKAGVIRLAEPTGEGLGLAEGIETALTAMQVIGWGPVWAAASSGGMWGFPVLPGHALTIFADSDPPGLKAARECAARWAAAGQEALIHIPPAGEDWNDAMRRFLAS